MPAGLLYYTQSEEVIRVAASRNELRGLLISRNEIAAHLAARGAQSVPVRPSQMTANSGESETLDGEPEAAQQSVTSFLPPTIDDEWACTKCYNVDACMLYRKVSTLRPVCLLETQFEYYRRLTISRTNRVLSPNFMQGRLHI